ncbi:MAG TPA: outer membrane beta-barrel protein [Flavisolibacter sp.]
MLYLQRAKTGYLRHGVILTILSLFSLVSSSQEVLNMEDHDQKTYYFGITLGLNQAYFQTHHDASFLAQDDIRVIEAMKNGGFALGLLATTRLSNRFELRFNPQLMFTERNIYYKLSQPDIDLRTEIIKKVESVITTFPVNLKFRSDRIGNFRVYMLAGGKMDLDLASNAKARKADDMIKIQRYDYGVEAGFGFNFYFPSFILSPEIKVSNGLNNLHSRNESLIYSRLLDNIQSRMIMFSIHLEG